MPERATRLKAHEVARFPTDCTLSKFNECLDKHISHSIMNGYLFVQQSSEMHSDIPTEAPKPAEPGSDKTEKAECDKAMKDFCDTNNVSNAAEFNAQHRIYMTAFKLALEDCTNLYEAAKKESNLRDMILACQKALTGSVTKSLRKQRTAITNMFTQATDINQFVDAMDKSLSMNNDLNKLRVEDGYPASMQKGHTTEALYDMAIDQFGRLGFDVELRRIIAEEEDYLDDFGKVRKHVGSIQSATKNDINPPISMTARAGANSGDDDDAKITLTRRELRAMLAHAARPTADSELNKSSDKPRRSIVCDGCTKIFGDMTSFKEHKYKHRCEYDKCDILNCPEPNSHCAGRHEECKQRKHKYWGIKTVSTAHAGKATQFTCDAQVFDFMSA